MIDNQIRNNSKQINQNTYHFETEISQDIVHEQNQNTQLFSPWFHKKVQSLRLTPEINDQKHTFLAKINLNSNPKTNVNRSKQKKSISLRQLKQGVTRKIKGQGLLLSHEDQYTNQLTLNFVQRKNKISSRLRNQSKYKKPKFINLQLQSYQQQLQQKLLIDSVRKINEREKPKKSYKISKNKLYNDYLLSKQQILQKSETVDIFKTQKRFLHTLQHIVQGQVPSPQKRNTSKLLTAQSFYRQPVQKIKNRKTISMEPNKIPQKEYEALIFSCQGKKINKGSQLVRKTRIRKKMMVDQKNEQGQIFCMV